MPPNMNWIVVYLLGAVTGGIFMIIWFFKELGFVEALDPSNQSRKQFYIALGCLGAYILMIILSIFTGGLTGILALAALIGEIYFGIKSVFGMKRSLEYYYNSVENIQLRLSPVMTFFFSIIYFQYHFTRIADWKTTGVLRPQG